METADTEASGDRDRPRLPLRCRPHGQPVYASHESRRRVRLLGQVRQIGPYADDPAGALLLHTARTLADPRDADAARAAYREHHERTSFLEALECSFWIHQVTGEPEFLAEARRRLRYLVENAPERYRDSMVERVPLYREILDCALEA